MKKNNTLRGTVLKILNEVDQDLKRHFLEKITIPGGDEVERWELVNSPVLTIIEWQLMRKKVYEKK